MVLQRVYKDSKLGGHTGGPQDLLWMVAMLLRRVDPGEVLGNLREIWGVLEKT